jgi:hypothetical protein
MRGSPSLRSSLAAADLPLPLHRQEDPRLKLRSLCLCCHQQQQCTQGQQLGQDCRRLRCLRPCCRQQQQHTQGSLRGEGSRRTQHAQLMLVCRCLPRVLLLVQVSQGMRVTEAHRGEECTRSSASYSTVHGGRRYSRSRRSRRCSAGWTGGRSNRRRTKEEDCHSKQGTHRYSRRMDLQLVSQGHQAAWPCTHDLLQAHSRVPTCNHLWPRQE